MEVPEWAQPKVSQKVGPPPGHASEHLESRGRNPQKTERSGKARHSSSGHTRKGGAPKRESRSETRIPASFAAERKDSSRSTSTRTGVTEQVPVVLSKTEGLAAVSAWKAREELASLLEKRADPEAVVSAIRAGIEGVPFYGKEEKSPGRSAPSSLKEKGAKTGSQSPRSRSSRRDPGEELIDKFGTSYEEQEFLLMGSGRRSGLPDWTEGSPSAAIRFTKRALPPRFEDKSLTEKYRADAFLPPRESLQPPVPSSGETEEESESEEDVLDPPEEELDAALPFSKKARLPFPHELEVKDPVPKTPPKVRGGGRSKSEQERLEKYKARAHVIFERMVVAKVKMELVELVFDETKSPPMDLERFALHTEPKSPNTGLRYVRLMERLLDFHESLGEDAEPNPVSKQVVTAFIEKLVLEESGYRTPQAMMYALDFFGVVFGFQKGGAGWDRCVKMAGTYASKRPPRVGADFFKPEFLAYLEEVVIGGEKCAADRLVAGRLRLCCQASIRHSDLVRTRLTDVEWCRDKGRTTVRGLRARVRKTKTGPRPWVASFLGVSEKGDTWLPVLMGLLLEHHGTSWRAHEFFRPTTASHNTFLGEPTTLQDDVARLKVMMAMI